MLESVHQDPLLDHITEIEKGQGSDYWSFRNASKRTGAHALIHYPAMMVPTLQGKLLDAIKLASPRAKRILDPFVGSGTVLVESMNRGMNFTGVDINPLAILACLAKSGPYFIKAYRDKVSELLARIANDRRCQHYVNFEGRAKWFQDEVALALSLIARNIENEPMQWARRLFWLALAKVIRVACNSRMSTYKLHIKKITPNAVISNPLKLFEHAIDRMLVNLDDQHALWSRNGLLNNGRYTGAVDIHLGDTCEKILSQNFKKFDIIMTSPPYGDNRTTIPYGQFAYLPLRWIPLHDLAANSDSHLSESTYGIDGASLGGSLKDSAARGDALCEKFESAKKFSQLLRDNPGGRKRFVAFFSDLDTCVDRICKVTKKRGYQSWTIGNRRIGGWPVPMETILREMLEHKKIKTIGLIRRNIHAKKMAARNSVSDTMSTETIVLARKL